MMVLNARVPEGPLPEKWGNFKDHCKLVNPSNKSKHTILVVGTGLAGAAAAATLAEQGYRIKSFCIQDSPRRAHSIAAQGGINAAKTTRMTAIAFGGCFTTPSKAETIARAKPTFTDWRKSATKLSITVWPKGYHLPVNTAAYWRTALLVGHRFHARFMHGARPDSSSC